jgi:superkiller protein 3
MLAIIVSIVLAVVGTSKQPAAPPGDKAAQLNQQGWALWQKGDLDAAAEKFAQAVKVDPQFAAAWNGLGWAKFNGGHWDEAEPAFQKAVAIEPNQPAALNGLGQLYYARGDFAKAEDFLKNAADNDASAAWWGLAKVNLLQGKYDEAEKWAQKIVDSGDNSAQKLLDAAKAKALPDDLKTEIQPASKFSAVVEHSATMRGWQAFNTGRMAQAKKEFEAAIKENPKEFAAQNGMGWALLRSGSPNEAKAHFEEALKIEPEGAGAMNGLAIVLQKQGKLDDAIKLWEQMTAKNPGVNAGTYGLADAYMQKKEYAKAIPLLEQIVQADPKDQMSKNKLERARKQLVSPPG